MKLKNSIKTPKTINSKLKSVANKCFRLELKIHRPLTIITKTTLPIISFYNLIKILIL